MSKIDNLKEEIEHLKNLKTSIQGFKDAWYELNEKWGICPDMFLGDFYPLEQSFTDYNTWKVKQWSVVSEMEINQRVLELEKEIYILENEEPEPLFELDIKNVDSEGSQDVEVLTEVFSFPDTEAAVRTYVVYSQLKEIPSRILEIYVENVPDNMIKETVLTLKDYYSKKDVIIDNMSILYGYDHTGGSMYLVDYLKDNQ